MPAELMFPSQSAISRYLEQHPKTESYFKATPVKDSQHLNDAQIIKRISKSFAYRVVEPNSLSTFIKNDLYALQENKRKLLRSFPDLVASFNESLKDCGAGVPIYIVKENHEKLNQGQRDLSYWTFFNWG